MTTWENASRNGSDGKLPPKKKKQHSQRKSMPVVNRYGGHVLDIEIEDNIPIPKKHAGWGRRSSYTQILLALEVGQSVHVPDKICRQMRNSIMYIRSTHPELRFTTRKTRDSSSASCSIWRTI